MHDDCVKKEGKPEMDLAHEASDDVTATTELLSANLPHLLRWSQDRSFNKKDILVKVDPDRG